MNDDEIKLTGATEPVNPSIQPTIQPSVQSAGETARVIQVDNTHIENIGGKVTSPATPKVEINGFDQFTNTLSEQTSKVAEAFARGDFIENPVVDPVADRDDRLVAALCYFVPGLMSLLVIFSDGGEKKRPFQRYHAVQSLGLTTTLVLGSIVYSIVSSIAWAVPILGWAVGAVLFCLAPILFMMGVVAYLYYGYQAYLGKRFAIPGLTGYLRDQGWL